MIRNTIEGTEETVCDACARIPLSHLALDLDPPLDGWQEFLRECGIEVTPDDLGRLSVRREVLGELLAEDRAREARLAAARAEQAAALEVVVPAGVPALANATAYESLVAASGVMTPEQEFGRRPKPNFIVEELEAGRRQAAERRAEAEALKEAQRGLEGKEG